MDLTEIRKQFPVTKKWNYLNHAVVSPLPTHVLEAVDSFLSLRERDGGLAYTEWFEEIESSRRIIGRLLKTTGKHIAFFQNTSHALNSVADMLSLKKEDEVLVSDLEFPSNTFPWVKLQDRGIKVKWLRSHNGVINPSDVEGILTDHTKVIAISHVCYFNGFRIDIESLSDLASDHNLILVVDAMQSLGALEIDPQKLGIDFLASNSYKWLLGPFGIATLYCREDWIANLKPANVGWYSVKDIWSRELEEFEPADSARRFETGHPNFEGICGLRASAEFLLRIGTNEIEKRVLGLSKKIREGLNSMDKVEVLSPISSTSGITLFRILGNDSTTIVNALKEKGIVVFPQRWRDGIGVKVSPHFYNTEVEVEAFLDAVRSLAK
jgi:selenocysteine lyase/cysteine desulfurase